MKNVILFLLVSLLAGVIIFISCKKEYSCEGCRGSNKPPIANAGSDQVITLPTDSLSLDGTASSDPDGTISSFLWRRISGPASFTINNTSTATTVVKNLVAGIYKFELKVTDNKGLSAKDTMQVIVDSVVTTNRPPIANAGPDQTITLSTNTITLNGSASADPDNNITSYLWTKISGPSSFNIANANAVQTQVTNLVEGVYQFELEVTDAGGLFSKDTTQVIVNAATSNNLPPVARAGNDTTIQSNQTSCALVSVPITLDGSSSYDPDGTIVSYLWTGTGNITNPNSAVTTVNNVSGTSIFILKVIDNNGASAFDTVQISILPANRPLIPAQLIPIGTLSQTRYGVAVGAVGNKILFAGGVLPGNSPATDRVDIYDIASGAWTTVQLSQPRFNIGTAILGNKIFFGGGELMLHDAGGWYTTNWDTVARSRVVDIYDASTNGWSATQLSWPRRPIGAAAGNKVVFAGGDVIPLSVGHNERADIYDIATNYWSTASLSVGRIPGQRTVIGSKIYFGGGGIPYDNAVDDPGMSKQIDVFDASSNTWSIDLLSTARSQMGCESINNRIYWGGGFTPDAPGTYYEPTNSVEIRNLANNTTSFDCLSEAKAPVFAVTKGNRICFFGMHGNKFDIFDAATNTWSIGVLPQNLSWPVFVSYNNTIYVTDGSQVWKLEF